ncbi:MAG: hypothetical protein IPM51_16220 [Sphingobacteriaceae bacterium]|nr:hypothetical protein [Sphingobacteriaceae bacterium]
MDKTYIEPRYSSITYELKESTKASYYYKEGKKGILPNRIGIGNFSNNSSSAIHKLRIVELKANYKKFENGKYKGLNKGDSIHTSIYPLDINYNFSGYGILDERHKIYDLVVFENLNTKVVTIHHFEGMAKPEYQNLVWSFLIDKKQIIE